MKILSQRDVVIGGYAETPIERRSGYTALELAAQALQSLLQQTGLTSPQIGRAHV